MFPLAFILAATIGGFVWGISRRGGGSLRVSGESSMSKGHFAGLLRQGQMYRLWLRIDPRIQDRMVKAPRTVSMTNEAFLSEALKPIAMRLGFSSPVLVTHDPTDSSVWCMLTRWASPAQEVFGSRYVTPLRLEAVQEPPSSARSRLTHGATGRPVLDEGLTEDEVWAVTHALAHDDDTKHLGGFATTFDPDYPVTAGLLRVKSMLAAVRSYRAPNMPLKDAKATSAGLVGVLRKASAGLGADVDRAWDRHAALPLDTKDQKALGSAVKALSEAHTQRVRGQTAPPVKITPAALQLAYSTRRPELSMVADKDAIVEKYRAINGAAKEGNVDAQEAQKRLSAATRYLERLQWVEWYKRTAKLAQEKGPAPGSLTGVLTVIPRDPHPS